MKRFTPILTFFAGCGFMLLISAKNQTTPAAEVPRYHIVAPRDGYKMVVYDAVTGEFNPVGYKKIEEKGNIRDLLNTPSK